MNDAEKLRAAADLIEQVTSTLDQGQSVCDHCEVVRYDNWDEIQAHRQLQPMAVRLRAWAGGRLFIERSERSERTEVAAPPARVGG